MQEFGIIRLPRVRNVRPDGSKGKDSADAPLSVRPVSGKRGTAARKGGGKRERVEIQPRQETRGKRESCGPQAKTKHGKKPQK
ncbi:MAG: hypothetical protein C6P37_12710 [Caldibacillus debilis]|uniref:Uncharacterized protein n=1 Tax=Caldibacillus debilis TaxID=301148 RepID=A0A3E0K1V3_9BACI|nr:hypothetical protein [Bacillaceae bacterium]REJ16551.1 MAG: hypothetical protein C6W57_08630 [Caldibacillus debilis]REJ26922.1 MAG: hypothetical protein C6P37_12710 [Caldibacillus debilis]